MSRSDDERSAREAGFTLVELLVVLVILGLIAGFVAPQVMQYLGSSKAKAARIQVERISTVLDLFNLDVGRYPSTAEGLQALVSRPEQLETWNGPYVRKADSLIDPWGKPYIYASPGQNGMFDLYSLGADGRPGGGGENADVKSWQ